MSAQLHMLSHYVQPYSFYIVKNRKQNRKLNSDSNKYCLQYKEDRYGVYVRDNNPTEIKMSLAFNERQGNSHTTGQAVAGPKKSFYTSTVKDLSLHT